jgi:hypothetical protein
MHSNKSTNCRATVNPKFIANRLSDTERVRVSSVL